MHEKERDRKIQFEEALRAQQKKENDIMEARILGSNIKDKLYEISMKNPRIWRELKRFEYDDYVDSEQKKLEEDGSKENEKSNSTQQKKDEEEIEEMEQEMIYSNTKSATKGILKREKSGLLDQKDSAAGKIGKAAKVKFDLGRDKKNREDDSMADEYLDMMSKQSKALVMQTR